MASGVPQKCCIEGAVWTGESVGEYSKVEGVNVYITGDKTSKKLIYFIPEVFGIESINARLLADNFARAGYLVVSVDVYFEDPASLDPSFDLGTWLGNHPPEKAWPVADKVLAALKRQYKPDFVASTGYCYGANIVAHLLGEGTIDVGAWSHPSLITEELVRAIKKPLSISAAEFDYVFTDELRDQTLKTLREIKAQYYIQVYSGTEHGFAIRGDPEDPTASLALNKALQEQLWYFEVVATGKVPKRG